jgi:hypothetical protein
MSTTGFPGTQMLHSANGQRSLESGRYNFAQADTLSSRLEAFGNRKPSDNSPLNRGPISPPPLRRQPDAAPAQSNLASLFSTSFGGVTTPSMPEGSSTRDVSIETNVNMPRQTTPPPPSSRLPPDSRAINGVTPKAQTNSNINWTASDIVGQLNSYRKDVKEGHARLTGYILESTKATERRTQHGADLFANIQSPLSSEKGSTTMRIKSKVTSFP